MSKGDVLTRFMMIVALGVAIWAVSLFPATAETKTLNLTEMSVGAIAIVAWMLVSGITKVTRLLGLKNAFLPGVSVVLWFLMVALTLIEPSTGTSSNTSELNTILAVWLFGWLIVDGYLTAEGVYKIL